MASSPITSWQIDEDKMQAVTDLIFLGFKITVDGDCSHEIKTVAPCKESYEKPPRQLSKKQRYHFANKGPSNQYYAFSIVMYRCESWTIKKTEHQRIDAFKLWYWKRLLRVP